MGRVQEGAFDPGPPPPAPPEDSGISREDSRKLESFREKCLRRLKEQEAAEAQIIDPTAPWYLDLIGDGQSGGE